MGLEASDSKIASFAELYAEELATREFDGEAWARFFDDLEAVVRNGSSLRGHRVLVAEDGNLLATPADGSGPTVFASGQDEDSVALAPPRVVRERLVFLHPDLPRRERPGGPLRPGWAWLIAQNLVREYATGPVLTLVGEVMQTLSETDDAGRTACLRFAFEVWRGARRELGAQGMARTRILVPAVDGWWDPAQTFFGLGWEGPAVQIDEKLVGVLDKAQGASEELERLAGRLISQPEALWDVPAQDRDDLRAFLEALGVRHGLHPRRFPARQLRMRGEQVASPELAYYLSTDLPTDEFRAWLKFAQRWPRSHPTQSTTHYVPSAGVAVLPGQFDWPTFDEELRRAFSDLVLRSMGVWPQSAFVVTFKRETDQVGAAWPSPVTWFLSTASWLPQTVPGRRSDIVLTQPSETWWLEEVETPDFLPAQPAGLRRETDASLLARLKSFGVRIWDDVDSAAARATELPEMIESVGGTAGEQALRKAYEQALRDLIDQDIAPGHGAGFAAWPARANRPP